MPPKIDERALKLHAKQAWEEAKLSGTYEDMISSVAKAVRKEFRRATDDYGPWVTATYPDKVIFQYPTESDYVQVSWSELDGDITFGKPQAVRKKELFEPVVESVKKGQLEITEPQRFQETVATTFEIIESKNGTFRVRGTGIETDVVNENGRRYRREVVAQALERLSESLNESAGQGRALELQPGQLLGEADHPSDKGNSRPLLSETVVRWEKVSMPDRQVILEGAIIPTAKGKDVQALIEAGVPIGISQRAYGESSVVEEGDRKIEDIEDLSITGYDMVLEPSSNILDVEKIESRQPKEENTVTLEELLQKHPELKEAVEKMSEGQVKKLLAEKAEETRKADEKEIREALDLKDGEPITEAVKKLAAGKREAQRDEAKKVTEEHIDEACKELPYGDELNARFVEAIKSSGTAFHAKGGTIEDVKTHLGVVDEIIESKRTEYDAIVAKARLESKGHGFKVLGSVLEKETGTPEFARGSHDLSESIHTRGLLLPVRGLKPMRAEKALSEHVAGPFIQSVLSKFDEANKPQLIAESKLIEEAETTADLNLPYSVARTIIRQALPRLVALSIFDLQTTDQAPTRLYFETYANETGVANTVTDENVTFSAGTGVEQSLANNNLDAGSVVVQDDGDSTTYVEDTDYIVDYGRGLIQRLTTGSIGATDTVHVDYTYKAIRKGENAGIERGKQTLSYKTLDIAADRLAIQITKEAVVFARSQVGEDAQARAIAGVITQVAQLIDKRIFDVAKYVVKTVANNLAGTWSTTAPAGVKWDDHLKELIRVMGLAKVKVANRFYDPAFHLMSVTNSDMLGSCSTFSAAGQRPDEDLNAAGYVGRAKGLPVFETTQFDDAHILTGNRELVQHRIFQAMILRGPYPTYDGSGNLIAADQWYCEEFNGTDSPRPEKGSYTKIG